MTTTVATNTTRALPLEAFGLQPDVTTPRRVEPMELEKLRKKVTRPPPHRLPTQLLINKNVGQVDGPAKSSDTTPAVTLSTSGAAGKKKKRGRPKKNPPKKKTAKSAKTDATAETPRQAPEATPQETLQVVNETTPQKEGQEE